MYVKITARIYCRVDLSYASLIKFNKNLSAYIFVFRNLIFGKHAAAISFCTLIRIYIITMSQRYISTLDVSQTDVSADVHEKTGVIEGGGAPGSDLLSGSYPIKVIAYKADTPLPALTTGIRNNYTVELHIGEREKIGQGTFGY